MVDINGLLENATVDVLFGFGEERPNLIRISRDHFGEIIRAVSGERQLKDSEIDMYLRMISDEDFIAVITPALEKGQYQSIQQESYDLLLEEDKAVKKGEYLFIDEKYLTKLLIHTYAKYEWLLKAMAIDYAKFLGMDLMETYKEYFENNNRIIEILLLENHYDEGDNHWALDMEHRVLIYTFNKKEVIWSQGEAENRFEELW